MSTFLRSVRAQVAAETKMRLRSPATVVTVLAILCGSFLWMPAPGSNIHSLTWTAPGGERVTSVLNAGYLGNSAASLGIVFLVGAAFYLVAASIQRDRRKRTGVILAATPASNTAFILGRWSSHVAYLLVLASLIPVIGVVRFWTFGEGAFDSATFLLPFLLLVPPGAAFVAALAVVFDVTPGLRGRVGYVMWFFFGMAVVTAVPMQLGSGPGRGGRPTHRPAFDPVGIATHVTWLADSVESEPGSGVGSGLLFQKDPLRRVPWEGLVATPELARARVGNLLWSVPPLLLALLLFERFDPARARLGSGGLWKAASPVRAGPSTETDVAPVRRLGSLEDVHPVPTRRASLVAEALLIWRTGPWVRWAFLLAGVAAAVLPAAQSKAATTVFLLLLASVVAEVAARESLSGTRALVLSMPGVPRPVVVWKAGALALFLLALSLPLILRLAVTSPPQAVSLVIGLLFVAGFAAGAGALTGGGKLFSGVYVLLWYAALNGLRPADYTGLLAGSTDPGTQAMFLGIGLAFVALAAARERLGEAR